MSQSIEVIKLVSGEEIIATVEDPTITGGILKVSKVMLLHIVQTGPQQYGIQLFPYLRGAPDESFTIYHHAIITQVPAPDDLARSYLSQTSGIEVVSSLSPLLG